MTDPQVITPPTRPFEEADRFFDTKHLHKDLKGRSVRGGTVTLLAQAGKFALQMTSTMFLARMLDPADFGIVAMVIAVTGFVTVFKDMGLSMATVQRDEINHRQVSTLFWVNIGISAILCLITCALAPAIAWFYGEPRLMTIAFVIAGTFIFSGLTVQHQALLRRHMRFKALAAVEVGAFAIAVVLAIASAYLGWGYWALVVLQVVHPAATAVGVWILCTWRPGKPVRGSGVRSLLAFGGDLTVANVLMYCTRNLDNVLLGWRWGAVPLGLYSKAYQLLLLPMRQINGPITGVAIPTLSRLQDRPEQFRSWYRKAVQLIVSVGMPLVIFTLVDADLLVLAVLGDQWLSAVPIFRALGPSAFLGTFNVATGWVYISMGQTRRQLKWSIMGSIATILAFFTGLPWGPLGVAIAFSTIQCILRLPAVAYCFKNTPLKVADLGAALWRPTLTSLFAGGGLLLVSTYVFSSNHLLTGLVVDLIIFTAFYFIFWLIVPGGRAIGREVFGLLKMLRGQSADANAAA